MADHLRWAAFELTYIPVGRRVERLHDAVLAEGRRVLTDDATRFDGGMEVVGVDD